MNTNDDANSVDTENTNLTNANLENINTENSNTLLTTILFQSANIIAKEEHKNIELNIDTHDKLYNHLLNELDNYKKAFNDATLTIQNLNNTINILNDKNIELEDKINKNKNIELLLKLKHNLDNKKITTEDENNLALTHNVPLISIKPEKNIQPENSYQNINTYQNVNSYQTEKNTEYENNLTNPNNTVSKIKKKSLIFSRKF
jgi:hypothetical protein